FKSLISNRYSVTIHYLLRATLQTAQLLLLESSQSTNLNRSFYSTCIAHNAHLQLHVTEGCVHARLHRSTVYVVRIYNLYDPSYLTLVQLLELRLIVHQAYLQMVMSLISFLYMDEADF